MSKVIAKIQKNSMEEIRITVQPYEGLDLVDIRVWVNLDSGWVRTKKGLCIRPELVPELVKALGKVQKRIE